MADIYSLSQDADLTCEVLVIGSGAGGAAVAETLVGAGFDVIMIEEGAYFDPAHRPEKFSEELTRQWRNGGLNVAFGRVPLAFAEGRCVGGSTEINSGIMQIPDDETVDRWARDYRIADFSPDSTARYFNRAFESVSATLDERGKDHGSMVLKRGAAALAWKSSDLPRAYVTGSDSPKSSRPVKQSMAATCLARAIKSGMRLLSNCRADRIETKGDAASSVRATATTKEGGTVSVHIRFNAVFVCAGAIHTPSLLRRSGFRKHIGDRLQFHPMAKALAIFDDEISHSRDAVATHAVTEFMPDQRFGGSVSTAPTIAMALAEDWRAKRAYFAQRNHAGLFYTQIRASGLGTVRNIPYIGEPFVRYAFRQSDLALLVKGLARLGRLLLAAGATRVLPGIAGQHAWTSDKDCMEFERDGCGLRDWRLSSVHLFGTVPPGENRQVTATDSYGKLYDMNNVFVADASQLPDGPGVNPQATVMALAYRHAEHFIATSPGRD